MHYYNNPPAPFGGDEPEGRVRPKKHAPGIRSALPPDERGERSNPRSWIEPITDDGIPSDVLGSYTGMDADGGAPSQDADDL